MTGFCGTCGGGIWDPKGIAVKCPHQKCKAKQAKPEESDEDDEKDAKKLKGLQLTKSTIETKERIEAAGDDTELPLPKTEQEATEKAEQLKNHIEMMEKMQSDGDDSVTPLLDAKKKN